MTEPTPPPVSQHTRDQALLTLLRQPGFVVAALNGDGFRVPVPKDVGLTDSWTIPVPGEHTTMLDLVVPAEGIATLELWEQACRTGMAAGTVHMRHTPEHTFTLTFLDMRHRHGVWLAVFSLDEDAEVTSPAVSSSLIIPVRPRTASMRKSLNAVIEALDDRATSMLGWTADDVVGMRSLEFVHPDDQERAVAGWLDMLSKQTTHRVRLRHLCQDGGWLWVEIENIFHGAAEDKDIVIESRLSDISDEMAAVDALDRREKLFRRLAESLPIGLLQLGLNGEITYANRRLSAILGVDRATTLDEQLATVVPHDRELLDVALTGALTAGVDEDLEIDVRLPGTGELRRCAVTLISLTDREGAPGALACVTDITESATLREELTARATFDALTGCYNRASTMELLDHELATGDHTLGVIFIDLNEFKPVNDTLGHAAGDELLVHTAQRLTALLRDGDVVGRLGGDEFLLVCRKVDGRADALGIARRVHDALNTKVQLASGVVELSASIGVACSVPGSTSDTLVAQADAAMYESKQTGDGPIEYTRDAEDPAA